MLPRASKRLALLLMFTLLIMWGIAFNRYLYRRPTAISMDNNHGTNNAKVSHHQEATVGLPRLLELSQSMTNQFNMKLSSQVSQEFDLQNMDSAVAQDLISRVKVNCRDHICSEFVTKADKPHFDYCIKKTWKLRARYREPGDSLCRFVNGTGRHPIALASFPGSGNTWVRGLIQDVTGLCTGAIYCDRMLRKTGFPGESIRSGIVLVVKTHHYDPRWTGVYYGKSAPFSYFKRVDHIPVYSSAIFLLRNPFDSLVSEYSRRLQEEAPNSHINVPKREYFGANSTWDAFIHEQASVWEQTIIAWIASNHNHPLLVVEYENLKRNTTLELTRMLDFLQVPYSNSRLGEVVGRGYSTYKRKHREQFDHYTPDQKNILRNTIEHVSKFLNERGLLDTADVSYLS